MDTLPALARPFVMQTEFVQSEHFVLPAGTVTFLLTDVEGSSRLWEDRPGEMSSAIARHYDVLDEAVTRHHGVRPVEQGEGDSIVAAFARAGDAVRAAVEAQRQLAETIPWLSVRMAVHTGEAQQRDEGNYVGRTIIRCARLRACAHGGQIVLSSSAAALVADDPGELELVDLGTVRLRDLSRPERVWQVVAPGLRSSFPALRSLDLAPHNLPTPLTSFVGREPELAAVTALMRDDRLVTLTGSGGCGKTRLALHAAAEMVDVHPGGTWWVDLAPLTAADGVAEQVAAAIGATTGGADPTGIVVRHLREAGPTLLIMDNAEHLLDAVASLVAAVLAGCPGSRVMVTSREPLGVGGEVVWRVPSMRVPAVGEAVAPERLDGYEAARLFLDRARRVRPNLVVDDDTAAHVVAVCTRLDGIPLALELAAARVRTVPLERLARGLADAFRLLTGGARTALPRQQTLLASIMWSVDLLDDTERVVLRRLAVFRGPFPLEAAEATAADEEIVTAYSVLDVMSRLVDKSLVMLDDETGLYRLLETIRQFSIDRLRDAGELAATFERHANWYAEWCESLGRGEHDFDIDPSHPLLTDVFAALEWAYDSSPTHAYRISRGLAGVRAIVGRYADFDRQYVWLAGRDGTDDPTGWAAAVAGLSYFSAILGRFDFVELAARAERLLDADDIATRCHLLSFTSAVSCLAGDPRDGAELVALAEQAGDDHVLGSLASSVTMAYVNAGRFAEADAVVATVEKALARRNLPFGPDTAPVVSGQAAFAAALRGDLTRACSLVDLSGKPDTFVVVATNAWGSIAPYVSGDLELVERLAARQAAAEVAYAAVEAATNGPTPMSGPVLHVHWVRSLLEGRFTDALDQLDTAHRLVTVTPALRTYILVPLGSRLLAAGRNHELAEHLDTLATDLARLGPAPLPQADLHYLRALLARADGQLDQAWQHAHLGLDVAHGAGIRLRVIDALYLLAAMAHQRGHMAMAARLFAAVAAERSRIGYVPRELPDPDVVEAFEHEARAAEPDPWAQGAALTLDDAVEYARRSRGERSRARIGWDSLTPTEQRVVDALIEGHSNDEIATRLLMSPATVKTHLTHIYAKTGTANRGQLVTRYVQRTRRLDPDAATN